jgi:hypothetical protein
MDVLALKEQIRDLLPMLVANREAADAEWRKGTLLRADLRHIQHRLEAAQATLEDDAIAPEHAYLVCATVTIDIRSAVRKGLVTREQLDSWIECYRRAGFSALHKQFNFPVRPVTYSKADLAALPSYCGLGI